MKRSAATFAVGFIMLLAKLQLTEKEWIKYITIGICLIMISKEESQMVMEMLQFL